MNNQEQAKTDAIKFLKDNVTAVIATSFDDNPRASAVHYFMDDDFNFYFVTRKNTEKFLNIELNPRAAVVVGTGPEHISIQGHGTVELVSDEDKRQEILKRFAEIRSQKNISHLPIKEMDTLKERSNIIFRLIPQQVVFMNLDSSTYPDSVNSEYVEVYVRQ